MTNTTDLKTPKVKRPVTKSHTTNSSGKKAAPKAAAKLRTAPAKPKGGKTRAVQLEVLLRRPQGVSTAEVAAAMGIQEHTARALISVNRRKLGWTVVLKQRRYRIV